MEVRTTYIGTINGKKAIVNGNKPDDMIVEEERLVLYPSKGHALQHISDGTKYSCMILENGDTMENYTEVERELQRRVK